MHGYFSSLEEALHRVVHDFPGGAVALAPLCGMRPGTLSNKVNPDYEGSSLFVAEAVAIQHAAQHFDILYAEAALLHHSCVPLGDFSHISDTELLTVYAQYHAKLGELSSTVARAIEDGRITRRECAQVKAAGFAAIQGFFEFMSRLEALVDE